MFVYVNKFLLCVYTILCGLSGQHVDLTNDDKLNLYFLIVKVMRSFKSERHLDKRDKVAGCETI